MVKNVHPISLKVSHEQRIKMLGQRPKLVWFTGLSGSGKSTLANATEFALAQKGFHTYLLDGDNVRVGLCKDLTFSQDDRKENIRRISEVCALMLDAGLIVLSSFISPYLSDRELVKTQVGSENFLEIFVNCPLEVCEERDVKGLYGKARKGLIEDFTGIHSPYEPPTDPFLKINTHEETVDVAVNRICKALEDKINL